MNRKTREPGIYGIGAQDRRQLAAILRKTKGTITPSEVSQILGLPRKGAADLLGRLAKRGWIARVQRGLYVPISLEASTSATLVDDPWLIADRLFSPCYIGTWSAAEHWGLTDQIFSSLSVFSTKRVHPSRREIAGTEFVVTRLPPEMLFGTEEVRRDGARVSVSDPSRTVIDLLDNPAAMGGIRTVEDCFSEYLESDHASLSLLLEYAELHRNATIFKRLGFLAERLCPDETALLRACQERLSKGYSQLDPSNKGKRVLTRWRLFMPERYLV